jgi:hypothetical protein
MPTIQQQVEALLDAESYESCWLEPPRPSFSEFLRFTVLAFEKVLPADVIDLKIKLASTAQDRIDTSGTYRSSGEDFEIVGQIVWVSKHRFFRGKPICKRPTERRPAPPDTSDRFQLVPETARDPSEFGTIFSASPRSFVEAFGEPGEGDEFKTSGMYLFEGNGGSVFRIYDYKETRLTFRLPLHFGVPLTSMIFTSPAMPTRECSSSG